MGNVQGNIEGEQSGVGVHIPMQDYKFLHVAVTILVTLVNTQTRQILNGYVPIYHKLSS